MAKWNPQTTQQDLAPFSNDPRVRKELRKHRLRILVAVLVCGTIVALGAKPAYRYLRNVQIDRNLEAAKAAARVEDWGTARNLARSVLLARQGDFEAFRIWHQALSRMGEPRTYMVAANLFTDPRASRQDQLDALKVMALQAPQAVALSAYASMDQAMQEDPDALAAIAPLLTRRGETALVEKVLRATPALTTDPAIRLELLRALCSRPTTERVAEARTLFSELISAKASEPALEALLILGETPGGLAPGSPLPPLPEWVNLQPKATTLHHLLALHPALEAVPEVANSVFQGAINRFLAVDPGTLGTWLIRHDQTARVASLLEEPAKTSPTAFIARLHALLREKRSADITAALAAPPDSCDLVDLELVKAAAARLRKDSAAETNAWNQALNNAAFDQSRNRFLEVGKYAGLLGAATVTDDAWVAAIRVGWGQIPLYRDLTRVFASLASQGRSEDLLAICRTLMRFEPHNPDLINNYFYLALLHEVAAPATVAKELEQLVAAHPQAAEYRSALALAYLMADRPQQALQQLPALKESKRVSPLMCRALEGSALLLTGQADAGRTLLEGVNWAAFMRAEALAFRNLLIRLELKNLPLPTMAMVEVTSDPDAIPAWRKAVERLEKDRARDVLPSLPAPKIPGSDRVGDDPSQPPR